MSARERLLRDFALFSLGTGGIGNWPTPGPGKSRFSIRRVTTSEPGPERRRTRWGGTRRRRVRCGVSPRSAGGRRPCPCRHCATS